MSVHPNVLAEIAAVAYRHVSDFNVIPTRLRLNPESTYGNERCSPFHGGSFLFVVHLVRQAWPLFGSRTFVSNSRTRRPLLAALLMLPLANACATPSERIFRWEEEFVLDSGEKLLLERTERYRRSGEPYNPMRVGWAPEDSTIVVVQGPPDLVGARYKLKDWITPVVLERDPVSRSLVMVGTAWNCDSVARFGDKSRGIYVAFQLRPGVEAEAIDFPKWAWGRKRKLYSMYFEIEPPARVTTAEAERHNSTNARGSKRFLLIDRNYISRQCGGGEK